MFLCFLVIAHKNNANLQLQKYLMVLETTNLYVDLIKTRLIVIYYGMCAPHIKNVITWVLWEWQLGFLFYIQRIKVLKIHVPNSII